MDNVFVSLCAPPALIFRERFLRKPQPFLVYPLKMKDVAFVIRNQTEDKNFAIILIVWKCLRGYTLLETVKLLKNKKFAKVLVDKVIEINPRHFSTEVAEELDARDAVDKTALMIKALSDNNHWLPEQVFNMTDEQLESVCQDDKLAESNLPRWVTKYGMDAIKAFNRGDVSTEEEYLSYKESKNGI